MLAKTNVTPNQISFLGFSLYLTATFFFTKNIYYLNVLASVLLFFGIVFDCVDGELARAKKISSDFGKWLDTVIDRIGQIIVTTGIVIGPDGEWVSLVFGRGIRQLPEDRLGFPGIQINDVSCGITYPTQHRQVIAVASCCEVAWGGPITNIDEDIFCRACSCVGDHGRHGSHHGTIFWRMGLYQEDRARCDIKT